jgi:hypothetical protein
MRKNGWAILGKALTVNEPVRWRGEKFGESVPALFEGLPAPVDVQLDEIKSDQDGMREADGAFECVEIGATQAIAVGIVSFANGDRLSLLSVCSVLRNCACGFRQLSLPMRIGASRCCSFASQFAAFMGCGMSRRLASPRAAAPFRRHRLC